MSGISIQLLRCSQKNLKQWATLIYPGVGQIERLETIYKSYTGHENYCNGNSCEGKIKFARNNFTSTYVIYEG